MIIEFELQGSKRLHKGLFDTHGLWVKLEEEGEFILDGSGNSVFRIDGCKIYSQFSFDFYHHQKWICELVYCRLVSVLRGSNSVDIDNIGYFRKVSK